MQLPTRPAKLRRHPAGLLALCMLVAACDSPESGSPAPGSATSPSPTSNPPLAAARIDLAKNRLAAQSPDQALALLVSALGADPASAEAAAMAGEILAKTRWHLPEVTIKHQTPVERIDFAPPSSLWVSLSGKANTTTRWNLDALQIESVLFPSPPTETRSLVFDPTHRSVVVERAGVALLCNAQTLKPIRDIGPLPDFVTPSSVIVFSPDGLLIAHPAFVSASNDSLVWNIRDTLTGEIVRRSDPIRVESTLPLAATLEGRELRVLNSDGGLFRMPVSPVEAVETTMPAESTSLDHAHFADNGGSALALRYMGAHQSPLPFVMPLGGTPDGSLEPSALLERFPWNRHPCIWNGLLREARDTPIAITDTTARILTDPTSPFATNSAIVALATHDTRTFIAENDGTVTIHRTLPLPLEIPNARESAEPTPDFLTALGNLSGFLSGCSYDEGTRSFARCDVEARLQAFKNCDFEALQRFLPKLDFSPLVTAMRDFQPRHAAPESLAPLTERLARASEKPEHPELAKAFEQADDAAVLAAIHSAGMKGSAAAKALELALAATHPEWIDACLKQAEGLPPLLRKIAISRIAWLQDRKADAIAGWPDVFPEMKQARLREDWDGWEGADFTQALEKLRLCVSEELATLVVPDNPTPEQRQAVIARLSDPLTMKAVGRARFARACLQAALALSAYKEDTEATFRLASLARNLGEAPAPCLRAEAMSLTALGDYQKARDRWVKLITEHPVEEQLPGDYAEAAYTSFENADPQQAMAILTTGMHRFPDDANFALRAGWVSLLTGNAERAYRFLLTGRQIGYPPEKLENATALLAIAAEQTGATEDAAVFYQDLIRLDDDWEKPETIETLEWPDELKAALRQLVR